MSAVKFLTDTVSKAGPAVQAMREGSPEKRAARFVYWEVAYNCFTVSLARQLRPPRVVATRREWDQPERASALAKLLDAAEMGRVAAPYLELDSSHILFERSWQLVGMRLRADDLEALKRLTTLFEDAEKVLRTRLFDKATQKRLEEAWEKSRPVDPPPLGAWDRMVNASTGVPIWIVFIPSAWLLYDRMMKVLDRQLEKRKT